MYKITAITPFYQKEHLSKEGNRSEVAAVANRNYNAATVRPVCWPRGSGCLSRVVRTRQLGMTARFPAPTAPHRHATNFPGLMAG